MSFPEENHAPARPAKEQPADVENFCAEVEAYIIARPFRALAIALLSGLVVGKLIL